MSLWAEVNIESCQVAKKLVNNLVSYWICQSFKWHEDRYGHLFINTAALSPGFSKPYNWWAILIPVTKFF